MPRAPRRTRANGGRVLVDSSAWIALVRARDRRHDEAAIGFERAVRERVDLLTTNLIVAEVQRFVLFHAGPRAATFVLQRLGASPRTEIAFVTRTHHERALEWLAQLADQRISYTDAVSFALMEERQCIGAMSFDADFATAGFRLWPPPSSRQ